MKKVLLLVVCVSIGMHGFGYGALKKSKISYNQMVSGNRLPPELQNIIAEFCYGNLDRKKLSIVIAKFKQNKDLDAEELILIENILISNSALRFFATNDSNPINSPYTTHRNIKLLKELSPMLNIHNDFLDRNRGSNNLLNACSLGLSHVTDKLLTMGTSLHAEDGTGAGPLHYAVGNNQDAILRKLIKAGADLNSQDAFNLSTPLHWAAWRNNISAAKILIEAGANINAKDLNVERPLHLAVRRGNSTMVQLLLDKGAKVDAKTSFKLTALHYATSFGHDDIVLLLLNHGANPEALTNCSGTSLHVAAYLGFNDIVATLIEKNVNVNAKTDKGVTPLDFAAINNHVDVIKTLIAAGADPLLQDANGDNALDYAASRHNQEALQAFNHHIHAVAL